MVSGLRIDGSDEPRTACETLDRAGVVGRIVQSLRTFPSEAVDGGRRFLGGIDDFSWSPRTGSFAVVVPAEGEQVETVDVRVHQDDGVDLETDCSCGESGRCTHAYAALYHLYSEVSDDPREFAVESRQRAAAPSAPGQPGPWISRLARLDNYLTRDRFAGARRRSEGADQRVKWRVEIHPSKSLDVEVAAFEQRRSAEGSWSAGRRVTWKRLAETPALWATPADEDVAELLRRSGLGGDLGGFLGASLELEPFDILEKLVDHRGVVWARDTSRSVHVVRGHLALALRLERGDGAEDSGESGDQLELTPTLDGRPLRRGQTFRIYRRGLLSLDIQRNRITVAAAETSRLSLIEHLLDERPLFPIEARDEVLSRIPAMEAIFPVEVPPELESRRVPADDVVRVLLSPLSRGGLSMSLRVRPLPDGSCWPPGEGPVECGRLIDEEWVAATRDPDREISRAQRLIGGLAERLAARKQVDDGKRRSASVPDVSAPAQVGWTWELADDNLALEAVALLQRLPAEEGVVEWPAGGAREVIQKTLGLGELRVEITDRHDLFGLSGFVEVEGSRVALAVLIDRVLRGHRFVEVDEDRFAEISRELAARLQTASEVAHSTQAGSAELEVGRPALPIVEAAFSDCGEFEASAEWKKLSRRFAEGASFEADVPQGLNAELRPYQVEGFRWMARLAHWGVGACLADDMGLGKTLQAIALLLHRREEGPTLVVAPTSVTGNWIRELHRFAPGLRAVLYRDTNRSSDLDRLGPGDLVISSYGLMRRDIEQLAHVDWGTVVLDEAQSIKNARSQTAKAIRGLESGWRLALTGTPIENHLGELWSLFRFLSNGLFGNWPSFKRDFAEPIEKCGDTDKRRALARLTRPFILRRKKSEVLTELPPRTDVQLTATLSDPERALYEDVRLATAAWLQGKDIKRHKDVRFDVLAALTKLRQLACNPNLVHPELNLPSAKQQRFIEVIETLRAEGHQALVFSQFTRHLKLLRKTLEERRVPFQYLDGQTPAKERMRRVEAFQEGEGDVFLISLMAGGTGLNLTAADYVIHMDPWWNPAVEDQATDRAHRMGQERPVTVYRMVAEDTIEEEIHKMQASKRDLISSVLSDTDQAAKLSTGELIDLITTGLVRESRGG